MSGLDQLTVLAYPYTSVRFNSLYDDLTVTQIVRLTDTYCKIVGNAMRKCCLVTIILNLRLKVAA